MHARAIDDAGARLRELRQEEWQDLALAGVALVLAVGATQAAPTLAMPLFAGGVAVGALGVRALWRRWDLVDRLAGEPGAYAIGEVRAYAARDTTMARRRTFAAFIRDRLDESALDEDAVAELAALVGELEDGSLELSPECGVACARLVSDQATSPLFDPELPLMPAISRIRAGFTARRDVLP